MVRQNRSKPLNLLKLEALLNRVEHYHPERPRIEQLYAKMKAGFNGEQSLDYYLSFLDQKEYLVLNDIRLFYASYYFQIDTLIIHPKFIIILEVKNFSGTLIFDTEHSQLIRQNEYGEEIFKDPVEQVNHQRYQLIQWLRKYKFSDLPVYSFVVVANDRTKIASGNQPISKKVIRNTKLLPTIMKMNDTHTIEKLTLKEIRRLKKQIAKHNSPSNTDFLNQFGLLKKELLTGVQCPRCLHLPMKRCYGRWICTKCNTPSKNAHIKALQDHFLLINPHITNQALRTYLHIESSTAAHYIFKSLNLKYEGTTKGRVYSLDSIMEIN